MKTSCENGTMAAEWVRVAGDCDVGDNGGRKRRREGEGYWKFDTRTMQEDKMIVTDGNRWLIGVMGYVLKYMDIPTAIK